MNEDDVQDSVTISGEYYRQLLRSQKELNALHAGGVDNWDWYSESLREAGLFDDEEWDFEND